MAKLEITNINHIATHDDRSVTVTAEDPVRGEVTIKFTESDARWFWAHMADKVAQWREEDGEER